MPISSTLWSMWGVVLQKRGVFFHHSPDVSWAWGEGEEGGGKRKGDKEIVKVWSCRREVSFFIRIELGRRRRERESEMRKKKVKVSLAQIRMLGPFW